MFNNIGSNPFSQGSNNNMPLPQGSLPSGHYISSNGEGEHLPILDKYFPMPPIMSNTGYDKEKPIQDASGNTIEEKPPVPYGQPNSLAEAGNSWNIKP